MTKKQTAPKVQPDNQEGQNTTRRIRNELIAKGCPTVAQARELRVQLTYTDLESGQYKPLIQFERECRAEGVPLTKFIAGFGGNRAVLPPLTPLLQVYWYGARRYFKLSAEQTAEAKQWLTEAAAK